MGVDAVEIAGCEIMVQRLGEGPPLVLLHGENGPLGARALASRLAKSFTVHLPRHPGWAGTAAAAHVRTVRDVAYVAQQYLESLGGPVPVVGLSFGGWVAAEVAAVAPRLVSSLVLVSPLGAKFGGPTERDFLDIFLLPDRERQAAYYAPGRAAPEPEAEAGSDLFIEHALADHAMTRYCWQPYMHDVGLKDRLRGIRAPTLILSGAADQFVLNPAYYQRYAAQIPGARHEVVAETGHRLDEEAPQAVADRIASFIAQAPARPTLTPA